MLLFKASAVLVQGVSKHRCQLEFPDELEGGPSSWKPLQVHLSHDAVRGGMIDVYSHLPKTENLSDC